MPPAKIIAPRTTTPKISVIAISPRLKKLKKDFFLCLTVRFFLMCSKFTTHFFYVSRKEGKTLYSFYLNVRPNFLGLVGCASTVINSEVLVRLIDVGSVAFLLIVKYIIATRPLIF